ncbi:MAG: hypothetical protein ACYTF6_08980 [Planctomycetota bacterium]|jgi:hypothetical protein
MRISKHSTSTRFDLIILAAILAGAAAGCRTDRQSAMMAAFLSDDGSLVGYVWRDQVDRWLGETSLYISGTSNEALYVHDTATGKLLGSYPISKDRGTVWKLGFSPGSEHIAYGLPGRYDGHAHVLMVMRLSDGERAVLSPPEEDVWDFVWLDGQRLRYCAMEKLPPVPPPGKGEIELGVGVFEQTVGQSWRWRSELERGVLKVSREKYGVTNVREFWKKFDLQNRRRLYKEPVIPLPDGKRKVVIADVGVAEILPVDAEVTRIANTRISL